MYKKFIGKILATVVAGIMCFSMAVFASPANAAPTQSSNLDIIITPMFVAITDCSVGIDDYGWGQMHCYADTAVQSGYTAKVTAELQRYSGGIWTTIKSWTNTASGFAVVDNSWYVTSGYSYRVKGTHQSLSGSTVLETFVSYSNTINY